METISARTPRAMEEFSRRLDDGVTFSPGDNVIHLDFSKIYAKARAEERPWNNGKEVPRWGVAEIQKMSPSTTGRCK